MYPAWLLAVAVVVGGVRGTTNQCWENPGCQDLDSENSVMACLQLCHYELADQTPVVPGDAPHPPAKRSYSMEHFRWGKPVGLKRRPVKTLRTLGAAERSAKGFPGVMWREMDNQVPANQLPLSQEEQDGVPQSDRRRRSPGWVVTDDTPSAVQPGGYMKIAHALQ